MNGYPSKYRLTADLAALKDGMKCNDLLRFAAAFKESSVRRRNNGLQYPGWLWNTGHQAQQGIEITLAAALSARALVVCAAEKANQPAKDGIFTPEQLKKIREALRDGEDVDALIDSFKKPSGPNIFGGNYRRSCMACHGLLPGEDPDFDNPFIQRWCAPKPRWVQWYMGGMAAAPIALPGVASGAPVISAGAGAIGGPAAPILISGGARILQRVR